MSKEPFDNFVDNAPLGRTIKAIQLPGPLETMNAFHKNSIDKAIKAIQLNIPSVETMRTFHKNSIGEAIKAIQLPGPLETMNAFHKNSIDKAIKAIQLNIPSVETMRTFHKNSIGEAIKAIQLHDPLIETMKTLQFYNPIGETIKIFQHHMESMRIDCIIDAVSKDSWPMAYENIGDFVINDDSTITVDSQTLTYAEIQDVMRQIAERVFNPSVQHLEHAIAGFIDEIRALRNPVLEKILTWLVFPIIVGLILCIIGPIADHYIKEYLSKDKKQLTKRIKKNVVESVKDAELLKKYRLVSIKTLNVRLKPSSKSSVLGKLNFGQPIIVIGKKGEWSQIVWSDDENMLQGWVFSKYLSKLQ